MKKDILIIGGGLGGLSTAISLARYNDYFNITLVEKNKHLGGKLNEKKKDGFTFDLGPSIVTMPEIFNRLFDMHNKNMDDYIQFEKVNPHWRNIFPNGKILDFTEDINDMQNSPSKLTNKEMHNFKSFLSYSKELYEFTDKVFFKKESENLFDIFKNYNPVKLYKDSDYKNTMNDGVKKYIKNPYLIDSLNFFIKYVGSSPYDAPAILNQLPFIQWNYGLWYTKGGMYNIARGLESLLSDLNVKVLKEEEVISLNKRNNLIKSVNIRNTNNQELKTINADIIVSNMEVIPFYKNISKEKGFIIRPLEKKYPPACSGYALHLGVNKQYEILKHHNFFFSNNPKKHFDDIFHNKVLPKDPTMYLVAPMKSDMNQGPKEHEIIKVLPHIPHINDNLTEEKLNEFKNIIIEKLEAMGLKDLRKNIVTEEIWTPYDIQSNYYSNKGSIYGTLSDKKQNNGFKIPKKSSIYKNLYFVGGSVNPGAGMPMVILSGQQLADRISKMYK